MFWILFPLFILFMMIYIFQYEINKHEKLTVAMEIEKIKKLADSNNLNDRIMRENIIYDQNYNVTG